MSLLCRVVTRLCALPLEHVIETMRSLPVEPMAGVPRPVEGVAIIRGIPVPVVDLACVFDEEASRTTRFVTVRAANRCVALAVDAVVGVRAVPVGSLRQLPPLLRDAGAAAIATIGTLDAELLVVLHSARLVPETVWRALDAAGGVSP